MLAARQEERRDYREAMTTLRRLIAHDPLDERAYRAFIGAAAAAGDELPAFTPITRVTVMGEDRKTGRLQTRQPCYGGVPSRRASDVFAER